MEEKQQRNAGMKGKHLWPMILCCAIPIVGIVLLSKMGILGNWGYYLIFLACPLLHVLMMRNMGHRGDRE